MCTEEEMKNLGLSKCNELPGLIDGMIETPPDFAIPAATLASGAAAVQAYIEAALLTVASNRIYYYPPFKTFEDISVATVYEDTPLSYSDVMKNKYRFRFAIEESLCLHKNLYTHKRKNGRAILKDNNGFFTGTLLSNGDFAGLTIQLLNPEGFTFNNGSVATKSPIMLALANSIELNKNGYMYDASGFVNKLESIVDVELAIVGTPTAIEIIVDIETVCDGTPLSGLEADGSDFLLVDDDNGAPHAITSATESTSIPGRYTLVGVAFEDSKLNLKAPSLLSIKSYESTGSVAVSI